MLNLVSEVNGELLDNRLVVKLKEVYGRLREGQNMEFLEGDVCEFNGF